VLLQRQLQCNFRNSLFSVVTSYVVSIGSGTVEHMSHSEQNNCRAGCIVRNVPVLKWPFLWYIVPYVVETSSFLNVGLFI
jgi:hypothetical protein